MKRKYFAFVLTTALVATWSAYGHHATIGMDGDNPKTLEGIVREIKIVNPHAMWIIEITDEARGTREVEFEGHSRNHMYRDGYREGMVNAGDTIRFQIQPMLDGSDGGFMNWFETKDGQRIRFQ